MASQIEPPPLVTHDLPGIGGRIKHQPEDFEVEEIPAYEPSGHGEFLYLWIEKRDLGAEYLLRRVAGQLGVRPDEIGAAGLKDRRAVTRQWLSVPGRVEPALGRLEGEGIRLLNVSRHSNKLRPGHLRGNRFRIRIRDVDTAAAAALPDLLSALRQRGLLNFYGSQRFGKAGETLHVGMGLLRGEGERAGRREGRFLRKLAVSAVQSHLFNRCLAKRFADGLLYRVLAGDVMAKLPFGGMFIAENLADEQARFDRRETVHTGPMFGRKMFAPAGEAASREAMVLQETGLTPASFIGFGKLLQGTRRHNLVYLDDLAGALDRQDAVLTFTLPAGSYATVLLDEVMKSDFDGGPGESEE